VLKKLVLKEVKQYIEKFDCELILNESVYKQLRKIHTFIENI